MKISIRRQLRILQAYAALSFSVMAVLSITAFTQPTATQRIDELTVQRLIMTVGPDGAASIDFLDADGKTIQRIPASR